MSRSRKHTPIFKLKNDKDFKRWSNKMIRHKDIPSGGAFKKVMNSWDICDYKDLVHPIKAYYADLYTPEVMRKAIAK